MTNRVIVVGAGPTGLMLAHELRLAGVECTIVEKRAEQANLTRAFGVASRTLELLDARGMADELVAKGNRVQQAGLNGDVSIDLSVIDSRYPMMLITPQSLTEKMLEQRCVDAGVEFVRGAELVGLDQDADGVTVSLSNGSQERAAYVVGCDGAHSAVRRAMGVEFVGRENRTPITLADAELADRPADAVAAAINKHGICLAIPFGEGVQRVIVWDRRNDRVPLDRPVTAEEIRSAMRLIAGTDFGMREPRWTSRFLSEQRQAAHYRDGRVLIAGDAAHTHSPIGAQGMNTGIGDAMNLGWKLAAVVHGTAPAWLLDTFESERHPVGASVLRLTDGLTRMALVKSNIALKLVQAAMRTALSIAAIRKHPRGLVSGIAIRYAPHGTDPHPLAGTRAADVTFPGGRLYEDLRSAQFVLLDATPGAPAAARAANGWADRVHTRAIPARTDGGPAVVLVRPDAYVAWASDTAPTDAELDAVLTQWCGPARVAVSS
ncbi:FAD-dependent monooxygenase [Pseudonocardia sp. CA-107938]|uniref:FAD-dependent monooxygenase n=1 Tax=Pseudonocardia sp. CA-107938 TaxID=3240021 RepID=UPI003D8AF898